MSAQEIAVRIEHLLCSIFGCERYGFGGEVNSDRIRKHPVLSITQGLAYLYALDDEKHEQINSFIDKYSYYEQMSLDEILSFDSNEQVVDNVLVQIEEANGLEQIRRIIREFNDIVHLG